MLARVRDGGGSDHKEESARQPTPVFVPRECMDRGAWLATVYRVTVRHTEATWHSTADHEGRAWSAGGKNGTVLFPG